jgi:hypothetical protein
MHFGEGLNEKHAHVADLLAVVSGKHAHVMDLLAVLNGKHAHVIGFWEVKMKNMRMLSIFRKV